MTPLVFAIVVSLVLIAPPVYAGMNTTELGLEESADINPEGSESTSEAQNELTNTDANETSTMPSDSNDTSEASTDNNVTGESLPPVSKKSLRSSDIVDDLSLDLPTNDQGPTKMYRVKVTFLSMIVFDNREGALSGDGEYDVAAYVNGIRVGLTDASSPGAGLWDISNGETVNFDPGTGVTLDVPYDTRITVFTVGSEVDGCGRTSFPEKLPEVIEAVKPRPKDSIIPGIDPIRTIYEIQDRISNAINFVGCKLDKNDILAPIRPANSPVQDIELYENGYTYNQISNPSGLQYYDPDFKLTFVVSASKLS